MHVWPWRLAPLAPRVSRFIRAATRRCFIAKRYSIVHTYGILLTHSASDGRLGCLHFGPIVTQAAELS